MAETAAHLVEHVFLHLSVRQWVLAVSKRLRYFPQCVRRSHRSLYIGKPTPIIEASKHRFGKVLLGIPEF